MARGGQHPRRRRHRAGARSDGRALLLLFLISDVGPDDAPTRVRVGSHHDVPLLPAPLGDAGAEFFAFAPQAVAASEHRPVAQATGAAGEVYLCHPFLVHAGRRHRRTDPKFMARPPLLPVGRFDPGNPLSPVERVMGVSLP